MEPTKAPLGVGKCKKQQGREAKTTFPACFGQTQKTAKLCIGGIGIGGTAHLMQNPCVVPQQTGGFCNMKMGSTQLS